MEAERCRMSVAPVMPSTKSVVNVAAFADALFSASTASCIPASSPAAWRSPGE